MIPDSLKLLSLNLFHSDNMKLLSVINATLNTITAALQDEEKVQLVGFGSFEMKKRAARTGLNPRTKEPVEIAATQVPVFKAGKALKDAVAK